MRTLVVSVAVLCVAAAAAAPAVTTPDQILEQYLVIHRSLASDSTAGVREAASRIVTITGSAGVKDAAVRTRLAAVSQAAAKLKTTDLSAARNEFGELSKSVTAYLQSAGAGKKPYQFYCPMAKKGWLQPDKETRNPYYGASMLTCGELVP